MTPLAYEWATVWVLWRRDVQRFYRQPSRLIGALGQPIIFWLVIGGGMASTFVLPGSGLGYREYFFPGVMVMVALFAAIFASVSVIEDRHQGFLQGVICGPGSDLSLVLGKCCGSASVALSQIGGFLLLAPLAGLPLGQIHWPVLLLTLLAVTLSLSALGFAMAWYLDNVQAYHAVQMTLLMPLWVLSGAMFPVATQGTTFAALMRLNPLSHGVALVRWAMYGGQPPPGTAPLAPVGLSLILLAGFTALSVGLAVWVGRRR
jgi:ABC-type multidrug transport system permease subunit